LRLLYGLALALALNAWAGDLSPDAAVPKARTTKTGKTPGESASGDTACSRELTGGLADPLASIAAWPTFYEGPVTTPVRVCFAVELSQHAGQLRYLLSTPVPTAPTLSINGQMLPHDPSPTTATLDRVPIEPGNHTLEVSAASPVKKLKLQLMYSTERGVDVPAAIKKCDGSALASPAPSAVSLPRAKWPIGNQLPASGSSGDPSTTKTKAEPIGPLPWIFEAIETAKRSHGSGAGSSFGAPSNPVAVYRPDPEYSEEARRACLQGTIVLAILVDTDGKAYDVHVARGLGKGLDEKAVEAMYQWRFKPGQIDGEYVRVKTRVEVPFRLLEPCTRR